MSKSDHALFVKEFTFADIAHIMWGMALSVRGKIDILHDASARPNVARWMNEITTRKSVIEVGEEWAKLQ